MGAAAIVPLMRADLAVAGDRAQLEARHDLVLHRAGAAVRSIDARLLRNADLGDFLAVIATDDHSGESGAMQAGVHVPPGGATRVVPIVHADRSAERVVVDQLAEIGRVLVFRLVVGDIHGQIVDGRPPRRDAAADDIVVVPAKLPSERVLHRRILMVVDRVDLDRDVGDGGKVDVKRALALAVIADPDRAAHPEHAARRTRNDADRAAFGVAAEQRALRSAQHFDPVDVEQGGVEALLTAEIDAVDVHADALVARGLVGVERHDPADADRQRRLACLERRDTQARDRSVAEIEEAGGVAVGKRLRVGDTDRDRRALEVRGDLGRRDDDHVETARCAFCVGGCRRSFGRRLCGRGNRAVGSGLRKRCARS